MVGRDFTQVLHFGQLCVWVSHLWLRQNHKIIHNNINSHCHPYYLVMLITRVITHRKNSNRDKIGSTLNSPTMRCFWFLSLQVLGVLSQDGLMRFININTHQLLFCLGSHDNGITTAAVSPNGRYIVAIVNNGSINIYCTRSLSREANKVAFHCGKKKSSSLSGVRVYVLCPFPSRRLRPLTWKWFLVLKSIGKSQRRESKPGSMCTREQWRALAGEPTRSRMLLPGPSLRTKRWDKQRLTSSAALWIFVKLAPPKKHLCSLTGMCCDFVSFNRINFLLGWIRRDCWLCSARMENILLNTGQFLKTQPD